jgi:manganese transport protein
MGPFVNSRLVQVAAWGLFGLISAANLTLMWFWVS